MILLAQVHKSCILVWVIEQRLSVWDVTDAQQAQELTLIHVPLSFGEIEQIDVSIFCSLWQHHRTKMLRIKFVDSEITESCSPFEVFEASQSCQDY